MSSLNVPLVLAALIPLLLSLTVQRYAQAWVATRLGDDTPARAGRLTMNPVPHVDVLGTVVLPLVMLLAGNPYVFGWAKPVPVDAARFRRGVHMGPGVAWTAAAGPLANLALALAAAVLAGLLIRWAPGVLRPGGGARELLELLLATNVLLALFNLIPVPPLDGSRIVDGYLPARFRPAWEQFTTYAPFLLIALFLFGGRLIAGPSLFLTSLLYGIANFIGAA